MNKAPVLIEKELVKIIQPIFEGVLNDGIIPTDWDLAKRKIAKGFALANKEAIGRQRDADHKYYTDKIREIFEDIEKRLFPIKVNGAEVGYRSIADKDWQSLKSEYLEGK